MHRRWPAALALVALLAGCASPPPPGTVSIPLDVPAARFLVPSLDALPPGYVPMGTHEALPAWPGIHDAWEVMYGKPTERRYFSTLAWVFHSSASAEDAFRNLTLAPGTQQDILGLGQNAMHVRLQDDPQTIEQIAVQDGSVVWVLVHAAPSAHVHDMVDLEEMARGLIARARAHGDR